MASTLALRSVREADVPAAVALFNRVSQAAYGVDGSGEVEVRTYLESPSVEPERDVRVVEAQGGQLIAWADVFDQNQLHTRFWFDLHVDPERGTPELVRALIAWVEERARATAEPGAFVRTYVPSRIETLKEHLAEAGYRIVRHSFRMAIELTGDVPEPAWPDGVAVRTMRPGDERAVYEVDEECFADHWDHAREAYEEWTHWTVDRNGFDPGLWFLAVAGDEIAGYALCEPYEAEKDAGFVSHLGVRAPWRRRGIALALLCHVFREFRGRGFGRVLLGVDAASPTGAVQLYEKAGMTVIRRSDAYEKSL